MLIINGHHNSHMRVGSDIDCTLFHNEDEVNNLSAVTHGCQQAVWRREQFLAKPCVLITLNCR